MITVVPGLPFPHLPTRRGGRGPRGDTGTDTIVRLVLRTLGTLFTEPTPQTPGWCEELLRRKPSHRGHGHITGTRDSSEPGSGVPVNKPQSLLVPETRPEDICEAPSCLEIPEESPLRSCLWFVPASVVSETVTPELNHEPDRKFCLCSSITNTSSTAFTHPNPVTKCSSLKFLKKSEQESVLYDYTEFKQTNYDNRHVRLRASQTLRDVSNKHRSPGSARD